MIEKLNCFQTANSIIFGLNAVKKIPQLVKKFGSGKVLIISDPVIEKVGLLNELISVIDTGEIKYGTFLGVEPEPRLEIVEQCVEIIKNGQYDLLIGFGGGSSIDIMKAASIITTNGGTIDQYVGVNKVPKKGFPMIAIPTTAGTGSEVTAISILSDQKEELKKGVVSPYLLPDIALVDPYLMRTMPSKVTAATGMDALTHAVEAFTSVNAYAITDALAKEAIVLIAKNLRTAVMNGENMEARKNMAMASLLAGMAFANAGVTAVHALAYPLGGKYHLAHGISNALLLPYVIEYNCLSNLPKFAEIAHFLGEDTQGLSEREKAVKGAQAIKQLAQDVGISAKLQDFDIPEDAIPILAQGAMKVTRLLANNPRKLTYEEVEQIYRNAYTGKI